VNARDRLYAHLDPIPVPAVIRDQLIRDYRAEVLAEVDARFAAMKLPDELQHTLNAGTYSHAWRNCRAVVAEMTAGKDTSGGTQPPAGESTQPAPFIPRTEREYWVAIADALNTCAAAGMPVGIEMDGTLTDYRHWSVVWDRATEKWDVGGYDDDGLPDTPTAEPDSNDWVICCSPTPRCPNGERRARAVERGWTTNGRAGNWLCAEHSPTSFFRPGRTYTRQHHGDTVLFRVEHVATPPGADHLIAFGWVHRPDSGWTPSDADDMGGWVETAEGEVPRG
jgi:hypothetical protein